MSSPTTTPIELAFDLNSPGKPDKRASSTVDVEAKKKRGKGTPRKARDKCLSRLLVSCRNSDSIHSRIPQIGTQKVATVFILQRSVSLFYSTVIIFWKKSTLLSLSPGFVPFRYPSESFVVVTSELALS